MTGQTQRHILLCVAGLTPQIITETLYALVVEKKRRVDEIRVITTRDGRDKIMTGVANGRGGADESLLHPEEGRCYAFCRDYPELSAGIKFDESCLYILNNRKTGVPSPSDCEEDRRPTTRTARENECAANQICEIVRSLTSQPHVHLHASAAGGRKTMSVYLTAAMQLFGRVEDCLSHVLVNPPFENNRNFYYKPPQAQPLLDNNGNLLPITTDEAHIEMAEIPLVLLHRIIAEQLKKEPGYYNDLVLQAQDELNLVQTEHDVRLDLRNGRVKIASRAIGLTPREFLVYTIFAVRRKRASNDEAASLTYDDFTPEGLEEGIRLITRAQGDEYGFDRVYQGTPYEFLSDLITRSGSGYTIKEVAKLKKSLTESVTRINTELEDEKLPARYLIKPRVKTGRVSHNWLAIAPEHILFEE